MLRTQTAELVGLRASLAAAFAAASQRRKEIDALVEQNAKLASIASTCEALEQKCVKLEKKCDAGMKKQSAALDNERRLLQIQGEAEQLRRDFNLAVKKRDRARQQTERLREELAASERANEESKDKTRLLERELKDALRENERLLHTGKGLLRTNEKRFEECVVCLDSNATHAFFPCGHLCCCETCSKRIEKGDVRGNDSTPRCPKCKIDVQGCARIFA